MEKTVIDFDEKIGELRELATKIQTLIGDAPVSKKVRGGFPLFSKHIVEYNSAKENVDVDEMLTSAIAVAVYGESIGQGLGSSEEINEQVTNYGLVLKSKSAEYREYFKNNPIGYQSFAEDSPLESVAENTKHINTDRDLEALFKGDLASGQRIEKLLNENNLRISDLGGRINVIQENANVELKKVASLYEEALVELESKKAQINDILGHVSGRAIAGDFEASAAEEKVMANILRNLSLGAMAVIVSVVAYSFWESTFSDFQWQNSIFRLVLAIMLSVPAAYLARESAKHREQQYNHLQTSLDLKAITPYISSLPENEQHKIKIDIASKLFAARKSSNVVADPYPANVHEIVMEIIKKLEISK